MNSEIEFDLKKETLLLYSRETTKNQGFLRSEAVSFVNSEHTNPPPTDVPHLNLAGAKTPPCRFTPSGVSIGAPLLAHDQSGTSAESKIRPRPLEDHK